MAYGIVHEFPGGTAAQDKATIAAVHPTDGSLPDGQVLRVAGATADGWLVVAIYDSKESWERFRDGMLMPHLQAGIDGGFEALPRETSFDVRTLKRPAAGG